LISDRQMEDNLHLRLFEVNQLVIGAEWNTPNVQSGFWRFYQNEDDGASLALANGTLFPLEGGRLYLIPAGVRFSCVGTECGVCWSLLHALRRDRATGRGAARTVRVSRRTRGEPAARLENTARTLAAEQRRAGRADMALQCRIKALLFESLGTFFAGLPADERARWTERARALDPVRAALDLIEGDLAGALPNARLAQACHLSPDHFARRFPGVRRANARALRSGAARYPCGPAAAIFTRCIEKIAEQTGFGNRFYFSRVFARHVGVSPAAYRHTVSAAAPLSKRLTRPNDPL
jgi:AraC-like DNA-binding protein